MEIKDFTKYFNYGYFLVKYESVFLKRLLGAIGDDSELNEPLRAGSSQYGKEKFISKVREESKKLNKSKSKDRSIERDLLV